MSGVNKVILVGNLGADPEIKYAANGSAIANIRVATSETWKDKQTGEKKEQTEWHRITFFGALADVCEKFLVKGSKVFIEGSIRTRKWQDSNGEDKYATEVRGKELQMLDSKSDTPKKPSPQPKQNASSPDTTQPQSKPEDFDDDIPF